MAVPYSEVEEALAHYGVLGMKWGVRKDRGGNSPRAAKRELRREVRTDKKAVKTAVNTRSTNPDERPKMLEGLSKKRRPVGWIMRPRFEGRLETKT